MKICPDGTYKYVNAVGANYADNASGNEAKPQASMSERVGHSKQACSQATFQQMD